jgi:hypothetical protein
MSMVHRKLKRGENEGEPRPAAKKPSRPVAPVPVPAPAPPASAPAAADAGRDVAAELVETRRQHQALISGIRGLQTTIKTLQQRVKESEYQLRERERDLAEVQRLATEREALLNARIQELEAQLVTVRETARPPAPTGWEAAANRRREKPGDGGSLLSQAKRTQ